MKTWFITGASRGMGAKVAGVALARGDCVVATAPDVANVVRRLGEHPSLLAVSLDVTDEAQARAAVATAIDRFGRIDVLLNNAGYGLLGAIEEATAAEVERIYRTNVFGLNISAIAGYSGVAGFGVYSSTKFAVEGLSEALRAELAPLGIQVTAVEPGFFRTDFLDASSLSASPPRIEDYEATVGAMRKAAASLNHGQPGDPDKLARVLVEFADAPDPPARLPLGSDTVAAIEAKLVSDAAILSAWRDISVSTDFAAEAA